MSAIITGLKWAIIPGTFGVAKLIFGIAAGNVQTATEGVIVAVLVGGICFAVGALVGAVRSRRDSD